MIRALDEHLSDARLAVLAAGNRAHSRELSHLASCRRCAAVHAELVRLRAEDMVAPREASEEILRAGLEFVDERLGQPLTSTAARGHRPRLSRRIVQTLVPSLALAALLLVMVLRSSSEAPLVSMELPEAVRVALIEDSSHGMVHPFVLDAAAFDAPVLRGAGAQPESMDQALGGLLLARHGNPSSAAANAALVAAFQAADQLANASAYLNAALEKHPQDEPLRELELIQFYLEGDFVRAEQGLRARMAVAPGDALGRLNLAILLRERGSPEDLAEASRLATELVVELGESALGRRARKLLG